MLFSLLTSVAFSQQMTVHSMELIRQKYLWLSDFDAKTALISASEELEREIPWLIVDKKEEIIRLRKGKEEPFFSLDVSDATMDTVDIYLFRLVSAMKKPPKELEKDVDVELLLLDGFTRELDRYSLMMYKEQLQSFNERISGNFSGIGCRVQKVDGGLEIQEVFPNGPAYTAGLQEKDVITHVNAIALSALTLQQGVDRLRGETGTDVTIVYLREGERKEIELTRASVRIPNVHWSVEDSIGIITIRNFSEQTMSWIEMALQEFEDQELKGLVMDLRDNGGGSMLQSCKVVDRFVKDGMTLRTEGREHKPVPGLMKKYTNKDDGNEPKFPMIVLVNGRSASASEIVAGSFKLLDRAMIMGQRTYGKGVVQTASRVRSGQKDEHVSFKITVAQYLLEDDYSVHANDGVEPHIILSEIDYSEPPFVSLATEKSDFQYLKNDMDQELDLALEILQKAESNKVQDLIALSRVVIQEKKAAETEKLLNTFASQQIDWSKEEKISLKPAISIKVVNKEPFQAGRLETLELLLSNSSGDISQGFLWLQAEDSHSPWDDLIIPVGRIKEEAAVMVQIPVDIPRWMNPRKDEIRLVLLRECCDEIELSSLTLETQSNFRPQIDVTAQIDGNWTGGAGEYKLTIQLENQNQIDWKNVQGRIIWPDDALSVRMEQSDWKIEQLNVGESHQQDLFFHTEKDLEELPELLFRLDAEGYSRIIRTKINVASLLEKKRLREPWVEYQPILEAPTGSVSFTSTAKDDQEIVQYEAWLNGQKIHWQEEGGEVPLELEIEEGHNNLSIYLTDNQGIEHMERITILGKRIEPENNTVGEVKEDTKNKLEHDEK